MWIKIKIIITTTIIIVLSVWCFNFVKKQMQIDKCLDSGGRWMHEEHKCRYEQDHY